MEKNQKNKAEIHNQSAPYWAAALIILGILSLSTNWIDLGNFWKGYVLDIAGPAWNYILFRGLFTKQKDTYWTRFFTPIRTYIIFVLVSFGIEGAQYLEWYESTYDPFDLLAYVSLLTPIFIIDIFQQKKKGK